MYATRDTRRGMLMALACPSCVRQCQGVDTKGIGDTIYIDRRPSGGAIFAKSDPVSRSTMSEGSHFLLNHLAKWGFIRAKVPGYLAN